jgi:DNA (cytosine-5)-methyltransferase 1
MRFKAISLFAGAGGMDVGVAKVGFNVLAASEIDKHACQTYRENHPNSNLFEGDINEHFSEIGNLKKIDLVFGGPPCQGFSVAGKMDPSDPRSELVFTFCDIVKSVKPQAFILENVKSLGSLSKFRLVRKEIFRRMEAEDFNITMLVLNAKDYGVPQSRERVFFIGVKRSFQKVTLEDFVRYQVEPITLKEAISHLGKSGSSTNPHKTKAKITLAGNPVLRKSPYAGMLFNGQGRPLNPNTCSSTLPASMGGNRTPIIDEQQLYFGKSGWVEGYHKKLMSGKYEAKYGDAPNRLRRLTIDEASILQTFPNGYKFSGPQSSIFSQIGNAVPCRLAEVVAQVVMNSLQRKNFTASVTGNPVQTDLAFSL